jgi:hypothetical protein
MLLIHYSKSIIESLDDRPYLQTELSWQAKPNGLWISVEDEGSGYNWREWCIAEDFVVDRLKYSHQLILKPSAKIIHLKTPEEIFEFTKKYAAPTRFFDKEYDTNEINWDEVKKEYQGIIISPYQWDCRLALESQWYYGWDCSSGCIWDLKCIQEFIPIKEGNENDE